MSQIRLGLLLAVASTSAMAGPYYRNINFNLQNTMNNSSRRVCVQRVLGQCVQWRDEVNRRTKYAWTGSQSATAKRALTIVADRMLDPGITRCALDNARIAHNTGSPFSLPDYENVRRLVWGQMNALLDRGFPRVNVRIDELGDIYAGLAEVGNYVDARAITSNTYRVTGEYNFQMDIGIMDTSSDIQIAGVMAHEMLHQMTHDHRNGYDDENFVVVYQNCFVNNGSYARPGASLHGSGMIRPIRACRAGMGR